MRNRILPIINLLLVLVCAGCIYYLATATYERPKEIAEAERILAGSLPMTPVVGPTETTSQPGVAPVTPVPTSTGTQPPMMNKDAFVPIYTPTPTPTPSPSPTPAPPDLRSAAESWDITSIDDQKVEFVDKRSPNASESFVLTVGGPPRETVDSQNRPISISLISIDAENNKVKLGFMEQRYDKPMFNN